jgi:putative PIN family toxin of toxin-antitoxin system
MNRLRVVLDTNIYISGLIFGGVPGEILAAAVAGSFILCVSDVIRDEVVSTLKRKFQMSDDFIRAGCEPLWEAALEVSPATQLALVATDPDDDRILECAVDCRADVIVTGDDHLLTLFNSPLPPAIARIRILSPRQFLDMK